MTVKALGTAALGLGMAASLTFPAFAQTGSELSVEEFYSQNDLTFIVSAAPGGGADFYGRTIAEFIAKYLPGQPDVVVQNLAGAGGMQAAVRLYSQEPKDGSVIGILQRNNLYMPLVSAEEIPFKPLEMNWIGSVSSERYVLTVLDPSPVSTLDDIFTTPIRLASTGFANENRTIPTMMNQTFGTAFEVVSGYDGSAAAGLAMERGEVDGRFQVISAITHGPDKPFYEDGTLKVLMQVAVEPDPLFPEAPSILDFTDDPLKIAMAKFFIMPLETAHPVVAPPGVPADRVAALREAFDKAMADPELYATLEPGRGPAFPKPAADVIANVEALWSQPEELLTEVKKLFQPD